jgi:hypothetical protein
MNSQGAYAGLRVLDLGQSVAAPYCAMLLAMHGARLCAENMLLIPKTSWPGAT